MMDRKFSEVDDGMQMCRLEPAKQVLGECEIFVESGLCHMKSAIEAANLHMFLQYRVKMLLNH